MRKTIFMGLGLALSLAGTAAAQSGQDAPKRERGEGKRGMGEGRRGGGDGLLFKDITLTDAQKTQVKALRQAEHDKMEANREQNRKLFDEARAARQRGDTAAARTLMQRNRQLMQQNREQHIAQVRTILTAEQRIQFDKNVAELKLRQEKRGDRFGAGKRGPRGDKPGRVGR
jgi:protein CpxP